MIAIIVLIGDVYIRASRRTVVGFLRAQVASRILLADESAMRVNADKRAAPETSDNQRQDPRVRRIFRSVLSNCREKLSGSRVRSRFVPRRVIVIHGPAFIGRGSTRDRACPTKATRVLLARVLSPVFLGESVVHAWIYVSSCFSVCRVSF